MDWFAPVHLSLSFCRPALALPVAWRCRAKAAQGRQADWPDARARGGCVVPQAIADWLARTCGRGGTVRRVRLASLCAGQRGAGAFVRANSHRLATGPPPSPATLLPAAPPRRQLWSVEGWENASGARGAWLLLWAVSSGRGSPGCEATGLAGVAGGGAGSPATPAPPWSICEPPGYKGSFCTTSDRIFS